MVEASIKDCSTWNYCLYYKVKTALMTEDEKKELAAVLAAKMMQLEGFGGILLTNKLDWIRSSFDKTLFQPLLAQCS